MRDHDKSKHRNAAELGPQDLVEFHLRWREFRPLAVGICKRNELSEDERETVRWLVLMADRIGRKDVSES